MSIKAHKIIVVDLELTCWGDPSRYEDMEIIEIGLCVLDCKTWEIGRRSSILVRPSLLDISDYCRELTGLTKDRLKENGVPLHEAINSIAKQYSTKKLGWAAWGNGDRKRMVQECADKNIPYPFTDEYLNISHLYAMSIGKTTRVGLRKAIGRAGLEFEGRPHSAADDAFNAARILRCILDNKGR
jgi:inhibitor of KinA sporulation pathway (predicted exonuclease)